MRNEYSVSTSCSNGSTAQMDVPRRQLRSLRTRETSRLSRDCRLYLVRMRLQRPILWRLRAKLPRELEIAREWLASPRRHTRAIAWFAFGAQSADWHSATLTDLILSNNYLNNFIIILLFILNNGIPNKDNDSLEMCWHAFATNTFADRCHGPYVGLHFVPVRRGKAERRGERMRVISSFTHYKVASSSFR